MKCFLHIGTEKTATTSIQRFLDSNRQKLLGHGFIYTQSAGKRNNRALSIAAYEPGRRDEFTKRNNIETDEDLLSFQSQIARSLREEIKTKTEDNPEANTVIFSSEHLHSRLFGINEVENLKAVLRGLGVTDIQVIVYLRRPADIANSLFSTALKSGSLFDSPPAPGTVTNWDNICNHRQTLERFGAVFGNKAITPRIFSKDTFKNGSFIDDFLETVGIPSDNYDLPPRANESLSLTGVNVMKRLNRSIPAWVDGKPNPLRANLPQYLAKHFDDAKYVMAGSLYEAYDEHYRESNEWVRQNYFPEREALFSSEIPQERNSDFSGPEFDSLVEFIANIWNHKQGRINHLQNKAS